MSAPFQAGLCECLQDKDTCLITAFLPCFTLGQIADLVGANCLLYSLCCCSCFYGYFGAKAKKAVRERYGIKVNKISKSSIDYITV